MPWWGIAIALLVWGNQACSSDGASASATVRDSGNAAEGAAGDAKQGGAGGSDGASGSVSSGDDAGRNDAGRNDAGRNDAAGASDALVTYGERFTGGEFHLGPVDWEESVWRNACASENQYAPSVRTAQGGLLAGVWNGVADVSALCDACIYVETEQGKSAVLRVVTFGDTTRNSIDVSPEAFALLDSGEYPRHVSWQLARCPDTGAIMYEFKSGAHEWWSAFWVRNARVPVAKVEIKGPTHDYAECERSSDGSLVDAAGIGAGTFSIRVTGIDGQQLVDTFAWPSQGIGGRILEGESNFE